MKLKASFNKKLIIGIAIAVTITIIITINLTSTTFSELWNRAPVEIEFEKVKSPIQQSGDDEGYIEPTPNLDKS